MKKNMLALSNNVTIFENHSQHFSPTDMVKICKRMNNPKRDFLFVNPLQGKHIPVNPSKTFSLFEELVHEVLKGTDRTETIVVIGFAETATAIGNYLASHLPNCICYMQTTREILPNKTPVLEFKEEHSHATEQLLYGDIYCLQKCDRVIFVDDEISTGNTILNFIHELEKINVHADYGVASILNWQNQEWATKFSNLKISTFCLVRGEITNLKAIVPISTSCLDATFVKVRCNLNVLEMPCDVSSFSKERIGFIPHDFKMFSHALYSQITTQITNYLPKSNENILVLGTEEYMFSPMVFGKMLAEKRHVNVCFHATTRSPIETSTLKDYAIQYRYPITSCYNKERKTYIYNLQKYDRVYIITDVIPTEEFIIDISSALASTGCKLDTIVFIVLKG